MKQTLASYGPKNRTVRVFRERKGLVRVSWYDGRRFVKSWPDTSEGRAEAKAWAKGFAESREQYGAPVSVRLSLRALWERFAEGEFPHLRPRTQQLYREHWDKWELFLGREFMAEDAKLETVDSFRASLKRNGIGVTHTRKIVGTVKTVYAWGERRELLSRNRLASYRFKIAKEDRPTAPGEYSADELDRILAQMNYRRRDGWRPWVAVMLGGHQGTRSHAILHLRWEDVDFTTGTITWRAQWDKTGKDWTQPMTNAAYSALLTAKWWAEKDGRRDWVFYSAHAGREFYRKDSLWLALTKAEKRAKISHQRGRGMHGFRRGVAGDVLAATRDAKLALDFIGDVDLRQATKYLKRREERLDEAVAILDQPSRNRHQALPTPRKSLYFKQARQESNLQPLAIDPSESRAPRAQIAPPKPAKIVSKAPKRGPKRARRPSRHRHGGKQ